MFIKQKLIFLALGFMAGNAVAESPRDSDPGSGIRAGLAPHLDAGVTLQYRRYSFFVKGDTFAVKVRVQNFYNGGKSTHSFPDLDGASGASRDDDLLGTAVPIGVVFGMDKNFQAYIQAEPNFDLNNDKDIKTGGAVGIRFQF